MLNMIADTSLRADTCDTCKKKCGDGFTVSLIILSVFTHSKVMKSSIKQRLKTKHI